MEDTIKFEDQWEWRILFGTKLKNKISWIPRAAHHQCIYHLGHRSLINALEALGSNCLWVEPRNLWSCHGQGRFPRASSGGVGLLALILTLCHPCGDTCGPSPSMPVTGNLFCGFILGLHFPPPQVFQVCRAFCFVCLPYILGSNSGPWAPTHPPHPKNVVTK